MARTIPQIYNSMVTEKQSMSELHALQPNIDNSQTLLNDLTSTSKVANWRLFFWVIAVAIWTLEKLFDIFKSEIESKASTLIYGNDPWYQQKALEFQYGDALIMISGEFQYATIDETKRIIKKAASISDSRVILKVAKQGSSGLEPLDATELAAFTAYIKKIKPAGTRVSIISIAADTVKFKYTVYYDSLLLTSEGKLISNTSVYPVIDAINNYIGNLSFPGILNLTKLTDSIQLATGVINPLFTEALYKYSNLGYQNIVVEYAAESGYFTLDTDTEITYIPYV